MGNKGGFAELSGGWPDPGSSLLEICSIVTLCWVVGVISVGIQKS